MTKIYTDDELALLAGELHSEVAKIEASDVSTYLGKNADKYNYFLYEDSRVNEMGTHTFNRFKYFWNMEAMLRNRELDIKSVKEI